MRVCKHGHEFKPENTYVRPNGQRTCRTCKQAYKAVEHETCKILTLPFNEQDV